MIILSGNCWFPLPSHRLPY